MITITEAQIDEVFSSKKTCQKMDAGLNSYQRLQKRAWKIDVSQDVLFQKEYIQFYKMRFWRKKIEWTNRYFALLQDSRTNKFRFSGGMLNLVETR